MGKLRDNNTYRRVYIRSSKSFEQSLLEQHTMELLTMQGKANDYTFNGSGKSVKKCNTDNQEGYHINPSLVDAIQDIIALHDNNKHNSNTTYVNAVGQS